MHLSQASRRKRPTAISCRITTTASPLISAHRLMFVPGETWDVAIPGLVPQPYWRSWRSINLGHLCQRWPRLHSLLFVGRIAGNETLCSAEQALPPPIARNGVPDGDSSIPSHFHRSLPWADLVGVARVARVSPLHAIGTPARRDAVPA